MRRQPGRYAGIPVRRYPIEIVPYDPRWPEAYERERDRISATLGDRVLRYEHMGSTSVPGLAAKPIVDISAAVASLSVVPSVIKELAPLGYELHEQEPDRYDLWLREGEDRPSHILHFMEAESPAWVRPLVFRNALRADPALRKQYVELKCQLAEACGDDIKKYGAAKTRFIEDVVDSILAEEA